MSLLNICNAGDSFISTTKIYGGSVNLFSHTLRQLGIECIYIDKNATDEEIGAAFQSNTKAVFGETIANRALTVFDIERLKTEIIFCCSSSIVCRSARLVLLKWFWLQSFGKRWQ